MVVNSGDRLLHEGAYDAIKKMFGKRFLTSPYEIMQTSGIVYDEATLRFLYESLPDKETLRWLRKYDFVLIAGPAQVMLINDIAAIEQMYFLKTDSRMNELFACKDAICPGWLFIGKRQSVKIDQKFSSEYLRRFQQRYEYSNASETVWASIVYKKTHKRYLFPGEWAKTSSLFGQSSGVGFRLKPNYPYHILIGFDFPQSRKGIQVSQQLR